MNARSRIRSVALWTAAGVGFAAGAYAVYAGVAWHRYGRAAPPEGPEEEDPLLDRFMPAYEVVERHHVRVAAPAEMTFAAARELDLLQLPVVRAIFRARELLLGATHDDRSRPHGLALAELLAMGWGVLAEVPGREVVVGAVTRPWEADPTFRAVTRDAFAAFHEPDYVKIAWTLRADPIGANASIFRTETRVLTTDSSARAKFRRYWAFLSPGIILIRWMSLGPLKKDAERRARAASIR